MFRAKRNSGQPEKRKERKMKKLKVLATLTMLGIASLAMVAKDNNIQELNNQQPVTHIEKRAPIQKPSLSSYDLTGKVFTEYGEQYYNSFDYVTYQDANWEEANDQEGHGLASSYNGEPLSVFVPMPVKKGQLFAFLSDSGSGMAIDDEYVQYSFPDGVYIPHGFVGENTYPELTFYADRDLTVYMGIYQESYYFDMLEDICFDTFIEKDVQKPVINGTTTMVINVNNRLSISEILTHFTAYDDTDGRVPVEYDDGTYGPTVGVGTYTLSVEARDKAGNAAYLEVTIRVVDIDKPVISGTSEYNVSYNARPSLDSIKSALAITDNYDNNLSLNLVSDNYSNNTKVGRWSIIFNTTDSSGNVSDNYEVVVNVHDKIAPVITAPSTITAPTNTKLTLEEIKNRIHIEDGYDGVLPHYTLTDNSNYEENYNKVGTYSFTVTATDANGNTSTFTINVKTEDTIAPDIFVDDYFIVLAQGETLTTEMIKEYASKVLGIDVNTIVEVSGDYDTEKMGKYAIRLAMVDGTTQDFTISVNDTEGNEAKPLGYFEKLWKDFTNVDNIFKFSNWNWLHYTASALAGILVLAVLASLLKKKR